MSSESFVKQCCNARNQSVYMYFVDKFALIHHIYSTYLVVSVVHKTGERSGSVVECLTRDRGAAGLSLTGVRGP